MSSTITEIKKILDEWNCPHPAFLADDGKFQTWEFEGRDYFRWEHPMNFTLPAVIYGPQGLYRVDKAGPAGATTKGSCTPISGGDFLASHLLRYAPKKKPKVYPKPIELGRATENSEELAAVFGGIIL